MIKNPKFFRGAATVNDQAVLTVPCGKCAECLLGKRNEWLFRIQSEVFHSSLPSFFVTFTYSDEFLPSAGVSIKDLQNFFKRLRFVHSEFKYYAVGEYGGKFQRPHYHVILINYPASALDNLQKKWSKGFVYVGSVEPASIKYVAAHHSMPLDELTPEGFNKAFRIVSKGLGLSYLTPSIKQYFEDIKVPVATIEGGVKVPLPRYLKINWVM